MPAIPPNELVVGRNYVLVEYDETDTPIRIDNPQPIKEKTKNGNDVIIKIGPHGLLRNGEIRITTRYSGNKHKFFAEGDPDIPAYLPGMLPPPPRSRTFTFQEGGFRRTRRNRTRRNRTRRNRRN